MRASVWFLLGSGTGLTLQQNAIVWERRSVGAATLVGRRMSTGEHWCQIEVPCELVERAEVAALGKRAESVEESVRTRAYVADALKLGLGLMEQASASSAATMIAKEVDTFVQRLNAWDTRTRERLDRTWSEGEARQTSTLEKYLGAHGALETSVVKLHEELANPRIATSIPAATAAAVKGAVEAAVTDVKRCVDASDESSEMSKFLRSSRADATQLRLDLEKAQQIFTNDLRLELRELLNHEVPTEAYAKGRSYELDVGDALRRLASTAGDCVVDTASVAARGSLAKVGDLIVDFETGKDPSRLAVEVKAGTFSLGGTKSIEKQIRDAMIGRSADVGLGVVRAAHLPRRLGWYTNLGEDVVIVAFEPDLEHGSVALDCAYKVLRAKALAQRLRARQTIADDDKHIAAKLASDARHRAEALAKRAAEILASLDRLRRMKKNTSDLINMLAVLRQDLDNLDRDVRDALREMDADIQPLLTLAECGQISPDTDQSRLELN